MSVGLEGAAERWSGVFRKMRRVGVPLDEEEEEILENRNLSSWSRARDAGVVRTTSVSLVLEFPVTSLAGLVTLSLVSGALAKSGISSSRWDWLLIGGKSGGVASEERRLASIARAACMLRADG